MVVVVPRILTSKFVVCCLQGQAMQANIHMPKRLAFTVVPGFSEGVGESTHVHRRNRLTTYSPGDVHYWRVPQCSGHKCHS